MYQLLCFCSFSAKHKELLNLIHFNIYQPLHYFDVLFTVDFLYLQYKIIVWKNTSKDIKDTLNKRIYFTVFPIRYFCVSGWFITFNIRNLCYLSLQCITGLPPFTATPFPQPSEATKYCSVRSLEFWRTEKPWHKITSKLDLECACTCLFLFRSRKKLLVSFFLLSHKWYRNFSSNEVSTPSFPPVLRDESVLIVPEFLYKPFFFLSPPEVGTKVFQSSYLFC